MATPRPTTPELLSLCLPDGRLNPAARGWSPSPHLRCELPRSLWGRRKRWQHYSLYDDRSFVTVTVADVDLASVGALFYLDLASGRRIARTRVAPLRSTELPDRVGGGNVRFEQLGLAISLIEDPEGTQICARSPGLSVDARLGLPPGYDSLNVVVPRDESSYLYSAKHAGRPARGEIVARGRRVALDGQGALDFARGVWPLRTAWSWGSGAGGGVAFNLGAGWTDGTGINENALWVGGRMHKIEDDVEFGADETVRGPGIDLRFTPLQARRLGADLGALAIKLDLRIGRWRGRIRDTLIPDLLGWSERVISRW